MGLVVACGEPDEGVSSSLSGGATVPATDTGATDSASSTSAGTTAGSASDSATATTQTTTQATTASSSTDATASSDATDPSSSSTDASSSTNNSMGDGSCGDGVIDADEQCDSDQLGGLTCASLGYDGGTLSCDPVTCTYDTSMCMTMQPTSGG